MPSTQHMYVCKASAGTGKTYTLAAHYIALLMNNVHSRNILAVTFTNKATAEMKQRIITYLNGIANHIHCQETKDFLDCVRKVSHERGIRVFNDNKDYQTQAQTLLQNTMSKFDDLSITTIDSFLQTLLTGLAHALGQAAGFGVDLDLKHAINTAVDEVLSLEVAQQPTIQSAVTDCLNQRLMSEDKWDLRPGLIKIAEQLYHENVQQLRDEIPLVCADQFGNKKLIEDFIAHLDDFMQEKPYTELQQAYNRILPFAPILTSGTGAKNYNSFFNRCQQMLNISLADSFVLGKTDFDRLLIPNKLPDIAQADLQMIHDQVEIIHTCVPDVAIAIGRRKLYREHLSNLLLAGYVIDRIRFNQEQNNTFLLAQTAQTLVTALDQHDAQFILMKAGIRYQHIMLDEFQDTSTLQWDNFKRLIQEILANNGTALIVGDTKQSIYRWRNGDYEIMNGLNTDKELAAYYQEQNLSRNFRSRQNIVDFNLSLFDRIRQCDDFTASEVPTMYDEHYSKDQLQNFYNQSKSGGYVQYHHFYAKNNTENEQTKDDLLTHMFDEMEKLLASGYKRKDILILCRTSGEAKQVLKKFHEIKDNTKHYPHLYAADKIISGDSFLLESSLAVNTIISALKMLIRHDAVAKAYIQMHYPNTDLQALQALDIQSPFTDLIEQIIRLTLSPDGCYKGKDIAHLNCLRDKIRAYISQYGSNIEDFLQYWDDKMHSDAVPAIESDHIRIMTIHASKGLQAKNVFIPFCAWNKSESSGLLRPTLWCPTQIDNQMYYLPVSYGSTMENIPELQNEYLSEKTKQYIDALNLLYVACTRAEDNLFLLYFDATHTRSSAGSWLRELYNDSFELGKMQKPAHPYDYSKPADKTTPVDDPNKIPEPFSFEQAKSIDAAYHSNKANIRFRQSQTVSQVMRAKAKHMDISNIEFGNLCHAVLEHIRTTSDLTSVLADFRLRGNIPNEQSAQHIRNLIQRLFAQPKAHNWFNDSYQLMREDSVLAYPIHTDNPTIKEFRMDRVMIRGNEAVVLDYKFGKPKEDYPDQVKNYMHIMQSMGYSHVRGYLWYAFENRLEEITL